MDQGVGRSVGGVKARIVYELETFLTVGSEFLMPLAGL